MDRKAVQNVHARMEPHSLNAQCRVMPRQPTASHHLCQRCILSVGLHFAGAQLCLIQQAVQLALVTGYSTV